MTKPSPACAHCGLSDKTYKISLLYLESTARLHQRQVENQPELDSLLDDFAAEPGVQPAQNQLLSEFVRTFAPPQDQKHTTRRIHPDALVIFFSLFSLLLVFQIAVSQSTQLPIIGILVMGSVLAYLLARKSIIRRYDARVRQEQEENASIDTAMTRWMHLYFCSRDKCVFDPERNQFAPLEQISDFLHIA